MKIVKTTLIAGITLVIAGILFFLAEFLVLIMFEVDAMVDTYKIGVIYRFIEDIGFLSFQSGIILLAAVAVIKVIEKKDFS